MAVQGVKHAEEWLFPETRQSPTLRWFDDGLLAFLALWGAAPISEALQNQEVACATDQPSECRDAENPPLLPRGNLDRKMD